MVKVEACIRGDAVEETVLFAKAAFQGGADTIELCGSMHLDGLTPPRESIEAARLAFHRPGLIVMVRPRGGDFCYSSYEIAEMRREIEIAAEAKADGVVLGGLTSGGEIDVPQIGPLIELSHSLGLKATFHRAFDAARDVPESLGILIQLGIDRILTSGVPWGESGSALDGVFVLNQLIQQCEGRTEIVIGGSVSPENVPLVLKELQPWKGDLSVHAYSGVMENDKTSERKVRLLVDAVSL